MERRFEVFGEPVEILLTRAESGGVFTVVTQTCPPGGGPPPHVHTHEDELFQVVSGRFEMFDGATGAWTGLGAGRVAYGPRRRAHTFRNCGEVEGTMQIVVSGGPMDAFLEGMARFQMPGDLEAMVAWSAGYGISYPGLPREPTVAAEGIMTAR